MARLVLLSFLYFSFSSSSSSPSSSSSSATSIDLSLNILAGDDASSTSLLAAGIFVLNLVETRITDSNSNNNNNDDVPITLWSYFEEGNEAEAEAKRLSAAAKDFNVFLVLIRADGESDSDGWWWSDAVRVLPVDARLVFHLLYSGADSAARASVASELFRPFKEAVFLLERSDGAEAKLWKRVDLFTNETK